MQGRRRDEVCETGMEEGRETGKKEFIICPFKMQYPKMWIILDHKY